MPRHKRQRPPLGDRMTVREQPDIQPLHIHAQHPRRPAVASPFLAERHPLPAYRRHTLPHLLGAAAFPVLRREVALAELDVPALPEPLPPAPRIPLLPVAREAGPGRHVALDASIRGVLFCRREEGEHRGHGVELIGRLRLDGRDEGVEEGGEGCEAVEAEEVLDTGFVPVARGAVAVETAARGGDEARWTSGSREGAACGEARRRAEEAHFGHIFCGCLDEARASASKRQGRPRSLGRPTTARCRPVIGYRGHFHFSSLTGNLSQ